MPGLPPPFGRRSTWIVVGAAAVAVVLVAIGFVVFTRETTPVEGVVGSEKVAFFEDERVQDRFEDLGYAVTVRPRGSRLLGERTDGADFVSPGSRHLAERAQELNSVSTEYLPFSTPMVLLGYEPVVDALEGAGVAVREEDGTWSFDMSAYLDLTEERTRWRDLPGDSVSSSNRNEVLVRTTDPRTSNSAAMHAVVLSYLLNGEEVLAPGPVDEGVSETISRLFLAQGQPPESSQQPFEQFRDLGAGHTPLVWVYESQYVQAMVNGPELSDDVVVLYPGPTVFSEHAVVPLTGAGNEVGRLLTEDPELQELAAAHGFRTDDTARFGTLVEEYGLPVRTQVTDVVHPPTYEALEALLTSIEDTYEASGARPPVPEEAGGRGGGGRG
ncbi:hypothetical protein [Nocardiopsis lucentensis]|uniref:hypothetical protein n=1 Tax=Nocardiopsis lucentensis TaxID=53441 RepID=UPI000348B6C1|nr:hypothetical protein [Nocardiopsis lucentensis]